MNIDGQLVSAGASGARFKPGADWDGAQVADLLAYLACELTDLVYPMVSYSQLGLRQLNERTVVQHALGAYLDGLNTAGRRLLGVVSQLLDLSALQIMDKGPVMDVDDVRALAAEAAAGFTRSAREKNINLIIEQPRVAPLAWCDSERVAQLLRNLIGSAIEHSPAGGDVRIAFDESQLPSDPAHSAAPQLPAVHITVSDDGESVAHHELLLLFDAPLRLLAAGRGTGIAALGLLICKSIVRQHGGAIWGESRPQGGLTVNVLLPRADPRGTVPISM